MGDQTERRNTGICTCGSDRQRDGRCRDCGRAAGRNTGRPERPEQERPIWICRACHFGHFLSCEDERCESMKLEDRHE